MLCHVIPSPTSFLCLHFFLLVNLVYLYLITKAFQEFHSFGIYQFFHKLNPNNILCFLMVKLLNLSTVLYICVGTENQFKRHCPNLTSFSFSFYHDNHQQPIKISCLKIYNNKFPHVLFFELYMHRNYCFSRKQHSYAACDAALAAKMITSS